MTYAIIFPNPSGLFSFLDVGFVNPVISSNNLSVSSFTLAA